MNDWNHLFKLDPAKELSDRQLDDICTSGMDAIIVGGTDNITFEGVDALLTRLSPYDLPCGLEVSTMDAVLPGFDFYLIPMVMNSTEKKWMMDVQHEAVKEYRELLKWETVIAEGYCILNPDAKAYQKSACTMPTDDDVLAYAYMAERMFCLPVFYLEYSGVYGDASLVKRVKQELQNTLLFYGGGINTKEQAIEMKQHADVIIVGNSLYTHFDEAIQTVNAIQTKKSKEVGGG